MQSKIHSLLESVANTVIGYVVALLSQLAIFPLFDIHVPLSDNLLIGAWFTAISLARSYVLRRWFTRRSEASLPQAEREAMESLRALLVLQRQCDNEVPPGLADAQAQEWRRRWRQASRALERF
jgi:hypothetical protein